MGAAVQVVRSGIAKLGPSKRISPRAIPAVFTNLVEIRKRCDSVRLVNPGIQGLCRIGGAAPAGEGKFPAQSTVDRKTDRGTFDEGIFDLGRHRR
jgi:hypothetical protein